MPFKLLKAQLVGLGERASEICSVINNNFKHLDRKKQNKFFIRSTDPAEIEGIELEPRDIWIDTSGDADFFTITIVQSEHQTIYVQTDDSSYSEDVTLPAGTRFKVVVIPEPGYIAGQLNITEGVLFHDTIVYAQYAAGAAHTIFIQQTANQTIYVTANGIDYTDDVVLKEGTLYSVRVEPAEGFIAGTPNTTGGILNMDTTVSATPATEAMYTITVVQSSYQTITVFVNGTPYQDKVTVPYGTRYTAIVEATNGYTPGVLSSSSGMVTSDLTISATPAKVKSFMMTIIQSDHQTIIVYANGNQYTKNTELTFGTKYTVTVLPDLGYTAGTANIPSGTIEGDVTIEATPAVLQNFTIHIVQTANQTVFVTANGQNYTTDISLPYGTKWTAGVRANTGYTAGQINGENSGTLTQDITITASEATVNMYWIHITQYNHQTITVTAGSNHYTKDIQLPYGTQWSASIVAETGYTAGTLTEKSGILTQDITISATSSEEGGEATINMYWIHITQYTYQEITVFANGEHYTEDIQLPYGTQWTASIEADDGYKASILNKASGTLVEDITVSALGEAERNRFTITIVQSPNQTITVTANGMRYTNSIELDYGTSWTASIVADEGYTAGKLNMSSGILTSDITIRAEASSQVYHSFTIYRSENQVVTVHAGGRSYTVTEGLDKITVDLVYGTEFTVTVAANVGYKPGIPSVTHGVLTRDYDITVTPATLSNVTITIRQSQNQTIHIRVNGVDHTSTFECPYGSGYTANVIPDMWWNAGELNIPYNGTFVTNTTVTVSETTLRTDYDMDIQLAQSKGDGGTGVGFNTSVPGSPNSFGSVDPLYIADGFCLYPPPRLSASYFYFWGANSVKGLFEICTITLRDSAGQEYTMTESLPNSAFDSYGDIRGSKYPEIFTQELYDWVKARQNQHITIHLHIE